MYNHQEIDTEWRQITDMGLKKTDGSIKEWAARTR